MEMEFKPYAKYGVVKLLMVRDIREKVMKIKGWCTNDELTNVISACSSFELAWKIQEDTLVFDEAIRIMDEAWNKLNNMDLFLLNDILWRIERL